MPFIFDYCKLRGRIKEKGYTQEELAKKTLISSSTFSQKLNNNGVFSQNEIQKICNILMISSEDIPKYFFCVKSSEN